MIYSALYTSTIVCTYICVYPVEYIINQPKDTTVCRGSDVTINCGYQSDTVIPMRWVENRTTIINTNKAGYQLNNVSIPRATSLTVFSISYTTTFYCTVRPRRNILASRVATVTVIGMYVHMCKLVCTHVSKCNILYKMLIRQMLGEISLKLSNSKL